MRQINKKKLAYQVTEYIREQIINGHYRPGDKIATIRDFVTKFGISHVPVSNAIKQLAEEGVLIAKSGAGTIVSHNLPESLTKAIQQQGHLRKNIYFFLSNQDDVHNESYGKHIWKFLQQEAEKRDWNMIVDFISREKIIAAGSDAAAIGIVHIIEPIFPYPKTQTPVIVYGIQDDGVNTAVIPDNYQVGWQAGSIYTDSACYKAAYFVTGDREPRPQHNNALHWDDRYRGVADALFCRSKEILPPPLHWHFNLNIRSEVESVLDKVKQEKISPVMLFVANRSMAEEIYIHIRAFGLRIPEDVSIISFIHRYTNNRSIAIDTFDFNYDDMGQAILSLLEYAWQGHQLPSRFLLPMTLQKKGSCLDSSY